MRSSIVKSLIVQINMTLVQDDECILAASTAHWSLPSDPAHIIRAILLEGSSGDFLWTCPHSLPPPPTIRWGHLRKDKMLSWVIWCWGQWTDGSGQYRKTSVKRDVSTNCMKGEKKLGTEMESDVDSDRRHSSSSFVKTHNEDYAISKSVNYKTSS